jgi:hypothetical protein
MLRIQWFGVRARKRGTVALLAILLALRVFWVPVHLALNDHGSGTSSVHALAHVGAVETARERQADHEHPQHAAGDHLTQLVAPRISPDLSAAWLPVAAACALHVSEHECGVVQNPSDGPARPPPPRVGRARPPPLG